MGPSDGRVAVFVIFGKCCSVTNWHNCSGKNGACTTLQENIRGGCKDGFTYKEEPIYKIPLDDTSGGGFTDYEEFYDMPSYCPEEEFSDFGLRRI